MENMRFMVIDRGTKEVVAGLRDIPANHSVFNRISKVLEGPSHHSILGVDERMVAEFAASGTKGTYSIWRVR